MIDKTFTKDGCYPITKPHRLRLPDGTTRTDPNQITDEHMFLVGYELAPPRPIQDGPIGDWKPVDWDSETSSWIIRE